MVSRGDAIGSPAHSSNVSDVEARSSRNLFSLDVVHSGDQIFSVSRCGDGRRRGAHVVHSNDIGNHTGVSEQVSSGKPMRRRRGLCGGRTEEVGDLYAHRSVSARFGRLASACKVHIDNSLLHSTVADLAMQGRRRRSASWWWSSSSHVHTHVSSVGACTNTNMSGSASGIRLKFVQSQ